MTEKGYNVSEDVLDRKMRNMKKSYRTIKDNNKKSSTGRGRVHWEYYDIFEDIFRNDATINHGPTLSSMANLIPSISTDENSMSSTATEENSVSFTSTEKHSMPATSQNVQMNPESNDKVISYNLHYNYFKKSNKVSRSFFIF